MNGLWLFYLGAGAAVVLGLLWLAFRMGQESVRHNHIQAGVDRGMAVADTAEHLSGEWGEEQFQEVRS